MEGPDLSRAGLAGYDRDWYAKHLHSVETAPQKAWKASFAPIAEEDRRLLDVYLSTCVGASRLVEAKAMFHCAGCRGCHKVSGVGGDEGPDLTRAGEKDPALAGFHARERPGNAGQLAGGAPALAAAIVVGLADAVAGTHR